MKCQSLTYEVGKTYSIDNMKICSHGFHFCENQQDVIRYYPDIKDFVLLEIEVLGRVEKQGYKSVTDKVNVLRIVPKEEYTFEFPIMEYDSNRNLIHSKDSKGYEYWNEYDSNGNLIHYKNTDEYECFHEYDSNGNEIHHKECKKGVTVVEWRITIE